MDIVNIEIGLLKPYKNNAKKHDKTQIDRVAKSIEQFGFVQPLVIDKNNEIIIGHCRYEAAKTLGLKDVPCVKADMLTEDEVRALRLADNRLNESEWDWDLVNEEIENISFDMEQFGFIKELEQDIEKAIEPDVEFTEVLGEEHNYIVLYFDNEVDWLQAESLFDVHTVKALSTRKDGKLTKSMERKGVGRVLNGAKALKKIIGEKI